MAFHISQIKNEIYNPPSPQHTHTTQIKIGPVSHNNWGNDGIFLSAVAASMAMNFGIAAANLWPQLLLHKNTPPESGVALLCCYRALLATMITILTLLSRSHGPFLFFIYLDTFTVQIAAYMPYYVIDY